MEKYEEEEKWPINAEKVFAKYTWKIVRQFSLVFSEYCTRLWYSLGSPVNTLTLLWNTHARVWAWLMSVVILNGARLSRWLLPPCRVEKFKLLGTRLGEDLKWTEHVNEVTSSCYKLIAPTRKVKKTKAAEQGRQGDLVWSSETTTVICVLSINVKL